MTNTPSIATVDRKMQAAWNDEIARLNRPAVQNINQSVRPRTALDRRKVPRRHSSTFAAEKDRTNCLETTLFIGKSPLRDA
jgi:hypothetical protein